MFEVQINLTPRLALLGCDNALSTDLFCPLFHQLLSSARVVIALEWNLQIVFQLIKIRAISMQIFFCIKKDFSTIYFDTW